MEENKQLRIREKMTALNVRIIRLMQLLLEAEQLEDWEGVLLVHRFLDDAQEQKLQCIEALIEVEHGLDQNQD